MLLKEMILIQNPLPVIMLFSCPEVARENLPRNQQTGDRYLTTLSTNEDEGKDSSRGMNVD